MVRKTRFARKSVLVAAILVSASLAIWLGRVMAANSGGSGDQFLAHLSTDKPIYRGGERAYFRAVVLAADNHTPLSAEQQAYPYGTLQITGPRGERVATGQAVLQDSIAAASWDIPADTSGGQYTATLTLPALGTPPAVRKFEVRQYRVPRLKGEIIFIRDGFGAGDTVNASLHVDRAEGGLAAGADVTATAIVDGATAFTGQTKIDAAGNCAVSFPLPAQIQTGDGTLSLAINDGGTVETIAKTIPILVKTLDIAFYPEGGDLVAGIPGRVYFEARTPARKPADLDGTLIDSNGKEVAKIRSEHEGRGRFTFTPIAGQTYSLKIAHPAGIDKTFALPEIKPAGVALQSTQDAIEPSKAVMLSLYSTAAKNYTVVLRKHQTELSAVTVAANAGGESPVVLTPPSWADGVLVATVFDSSGTPVAERLIFRQPAHSIHVTIMPDKSTYIPGELANLTVTTTDDSGKPVTAMVGVTVSDESVFGMLEKRDRPPELREMVYLEDDVNEFQDAETYLSADDAKSALATDLLLGTQGWRRFAFVDSDTFLKANGDAGRRVLADMQPQPILVQSAAAAGGRGGGFGGAGGAAGGGGLGGGGRGARGGRGGGGAAQAAAPPPDENAGVVQDRVALQEAAKQLPENAPAHRAPVGIALPPRDPNAAADQLDQRIPQVVAGRGGRGRAAIRQRIVVVREYAHDLRPGRIEGERQDFSETLYWNAGIMTDTNGVAKVSFHLNDSVNSFRVTADAFDGAGVLGEANASISSIQPFYVEAKVPLEVTTGDQIRLPISAVNGTSDPLHDVKLHVSASPAFTIAPIDSFSLDAQKRDRRFADFTVGELPEIIGLNVQADAGAFTDNVTRTIRVRPRGFPIVENHSGILAGNSTISHVIEIPESVVSGSIQTSFALYPTPLGNLTDSLKQLLQEPYGCFEQTSSTTYPLVMADQYFLTHTGVDPALISRSNDLLDKGYQRLVSFECSKKGYEWFGEDPGHECLTAYGLLEFSDMSSVRTVDSTMLTETRTWLLAHRDGNGGFTHERRALHTWIADPDCANGYCTWALLETGEKNLDKEIGWLKEHAATDSNSYVTALAANAMFLAGDHSAATTFMQALAQRQDQDGHVNGATTSVVGSGGIALEIETTSLATLAWLRDPQFAANVERGMRFLADSCQGGRFGSTQSTVLALRAIIAYDKSRAHPTVPGNVQLMVDARPFGQPIPFDANTQGVIALPDFSSRLTPGKHTIEVTMTGGSDLPYALQIAYNGITPASSDQCALTLQTVLKDAKVDEGAATQETVTLTNHTDAAVPTPVAIIGLPGGLEIRHDQLKELVKADRIAAYEVRGCEVILYWRDLGPHQSVEVPLSVIAAIPGTYTAPASRAYLYYTDEFKQWAAGTTVTINAK